MIAKGVSTTTSNNQNQQPTKNISEKLIQNEGILNSSENESPTNTPKRQDDSANISTSGTKNIHTKTIKKKTQKKKKRKKLKPKNLVLKVIELFFETNRQVGYDGETVDEKIIHLQNVPINIPMKKLMKWISSIGKYQKLFQYAENHKPDLKNIVICFNTKKSAMEIFQYQDKPWKDVIECYFSDTIKLSWYFYTLSRPHPHHKLFIGQIEPNISQETLTGIFQQFGHVEECFILKKGQGHTKNSAFIRFKEESEAKNAIQYSRNHILIPESPSMIVRYARKGKRDRIRKTERKQATKKQYNVVWPQWTYIMHPAPLTFAPAPTNISTSTGLVTFQDPTTYFTPQLVNLISNEFVNQYGRSFHGILQVYMKHLVVEFSDEEALERATGPFQLDNGLLLRLSHFVSNK